jgi:hypothetical protein
MRFKYPLLKSAVMLANPAVKIERESFDCVFIPYVGLTEATCGEATYANAGSINRTDLPIRAAV